MRNRVEGQVHVIIPCRVSDTCIAASLTAASTARNLELVSPNPSSSCRGHSGYISSTRHRHWAAVYDAWELVGTASIRQRSLDMDEKFWFLKNWQLFERLTPDQIEQLECR